MMVSGEVERQLRGLPCDCRFYMGWISVIRPCNVYLVNRATGQIATVYVVIPKRRHQRKKHAFEPQRGKGKKHA
jgi:hypothetical protein